MRTAIVGSRSITDYNIVLETITKSRIKISVVISGGALGVDQLAEKYARDRKIPCVVYRPDWSLGIGAGMARNKKIVDDSSTLIAIWDGISKGTKHSIDYAMKQGKNVFYFNSKLGTFLDFPNLQLCDSQPSSN